MNISRSWTGSSGEASINVEIGSRGLTGTMTNKAGTHKVTRIEVVKGKKVIPFTYKGKPAFQVLPGELYDEIFQALKNSFTPTEREELEGKIEVAKREYHKALNIGPIEANKWLDEWNELSDKLAQL